MEEATDFQPIRINSKDELSEERLPLFYIDDKEYGMLKVIPGRIAMEMLEVIKERGDAAGAAYALKAVLGEKAYQVLRKNRVITAGQLKAIMEAVTTHVMGQVEDITEK